MKKLVTLLVALSLLLGCAALAESEAKPILFRGIPWGSSYTQIAEELDLGSLNSFSDHYDGGVAYDLYRGEPILTLDAATGGFGVATVGEVAGYPVDSCRVLFARVPGDDGLLTEYDADTAMYYAYYYFKPADPEATISDLTNKLSGLYGEADLSHEGYFLWHGAEGTMVCLRQDNNGDTYIRYSFEGGDDLLRAAQDAVNLARSQNVDGL